MWWNEFHFPPGHLFLVLAPTHLRFSIADRDHGDAIIDGANQRAKIAADAILLAHLGNRLAGNAAWAQSVTVWIYQIDALMRPIFAGNIAEVAPDALVIVDAGNALIAQVQCFPLLNGGNGFPNQIHHTFVTFRIEIIVQAFDHIFDDAETVVHDRSANLHARRAQRNELGSVTPVADSADAGNWQPHFRV